MSNYLAIATVSAALGNTVHAAANGAVAGTTLRFGRPTQTAANLRQANIYLYQALPVSAFRNADRPQFDGGGQRTGPRTAFTLHYLVSFYGDEANFEPETMLGAALRDLQAMPVLRDRDIADAIAKNPVLAGSNLGDSPERVKLTPLVMSLEDLSRLWSGILQAPYALSTVLTAEMVILDTPGVATNSAPVLKRKLSDR